MTFPLRRAKSPLSWSVVAVLAACAAPESSEAPRGAGASENLAAGAEPLSAPRWAPSPVAHGPVAPAPPRRPSLGTRLRTERIGGVHFTAETGEYRQVARLIQTSTGIPVIITPAAADVINAQGLRLELELVAPIAVRNLLDHMTGQSADLAWTVRSGVVQITSRAESGRSNVLRVYDVRDLTFARTSFLPPVIKGIPGEEDEGAPRGGSESEDKVAWIEGDQLIDNVRLATDPKYWETDGDASIEYLESGMLVVKASPEMHRRVAGFLGR